MQQALRKLIPSLSSSTHVLTSLLGQFLLHRSWKAPVTQPGRFGGTSSREVPAAPALLRVALRVLHSVADHRTAADSPLAKKVTFLSWILYW